MSDVSSMLEGMNFSHVGYMPVTAAFCRKTGPADTVDKCVPTGMAVDVGTVVSFMVLDTLSGRSPLCRPEKSARSVDTGLLPGREIPPKAFNDTTPGRAMDAIFEAGTEKLFSQVAFRAARAFPPDVDTRHVHLDTTSVSVWGDYSLCEEGDDDGLKITYGHSKDRRPDLKQFLVKMLCLHRNIPVVGGCESGNESDKRINDEMLTNLSKHMARWAWRSAFVYISDSSVVTPKNLEAPGSNLFITRLPFTYGETDRVIAEAVRAGDWRDVETAVLSSGNLKAADYRVCETSVTIGDKCYRSIVVHSDAHDRRKLKKLERVLSESRDKAAETLKDSCRIEYYCREDAPAAAEKLRGDESLLHYCECRVEEKSTYARGRPPKNGERKVTKVRYVLAGELVERREEVERAGEAAGCFVLLTNTPSEGEMAHAPEEVLFSYKEQHGIERDSGFLKDPTIVNDIFFKRPDRIEVLGFILLVSLLACNLMEHVMRAYLKRTDSTITGWDNKQTTGPTSFLMTTMFKGVPVVEFKGRWHFADPLTEERKEYVRALGLTEELLLGRG